MRSGLFGTRSLDTAVHGRRTVTQAGRARPAGWILAGSMLAGSMLLAACGQRGPLYLPTVPADPRTKDQASPGMLQAPAQRELPAPGQGADEPARRP
jgi:predicted small lipoprotein YifL